MKNYKHISKLLSLALRHQPHVLNLTLDEGGWVSVSVLLAALEQQNKGVSLDELKEMVAENDKKRFAFSEDGTKIRASQGHSIPVDLGLEPVTPPQYLYHGTADKNVESILQEGLIKRSRQHVHLSLDTETAIKVGQRHGKPIVLRIDSEKMYQDGLSFYLSANQVWLTDSVPAQYIVKD